MRLDDGLPTPTKRGQHLLTFDQIKELIDLVRESRLQGIEIERSGFRLRIDGQRPAAAGSATSSSPLQVAPIEALPGSSTASVIDPHQAPVLENKPPELPQDEGHQLKSPIVGTFYSAPSPETEPYTSVGQIVKKGQVICIIEAMKLMNEIEADMTGEVLAVYPENAQPVEYGEPLFLIRPSS